MAFSPGGLVHNWRLKAAALGLAVFLWALVQTEPLSQEVFTSVPLRVEVLDTAWTISGPPSPPTVDLWLGGPAGEIIRLAREGPSVRVPVDAIGTQDTVIRLRRDWVRLGDRRGVTVENISPSDVRIAFERAMTRTVQVLPRLQGSLPEHLALAEDISLTPSQVRVHGPRSRIENLESMRLEPLDLEAVAESGVFTLLVDTTGLAGGWVVPTTVALTIDVEAEVERTLGGLAVVLPGAEQRDLVVSPRSVQVRLTGARSLVTGVHQSMLSVRVAPEFLDGMLPGEERRVPLQVDGAPGLVILSPVPDVVSVRRATGQAPSS